MSKVAAASLIEDLDFYPRASVDGQWVRELAEAYEAGASFPALVADRKSKRLVDGWHRRRAILRVDPDAKVDVQWRDYADDAELFADSVACNPGARRFTTWDYARIRVRSHELGLSEERVATLIRRSPERVRSLPIAVRRLPGGGSLEVPLKRPLRHLSGMEISEEQQRVNASSSGWSPEYHARQLTMLLGTNDYPMSEQLAAALSELRAVLDSMEVLV
jgi:hypothetical protein